MTLDDCVVQVVTDRHDRGETSFASQVALAVLSVWKGPWTREPERDVIRSLVRARLTKALIFSPTRGWLPVSRFLIRENLSWAVIQVSDRFYDAIRRKAKRLGDRVHTVFERALDEAITERTPPPEPSVALDVRVKPPLRYSHHAMRCDYGTIYYYGNLGIAIDRRGRFAGVDWACRGVGED